jgi:hypothetical protein
MKNYSVVKTKIFMAKCMELEDIMLNDINLDRKTNVTCSLSYLEDENKS